MLAVGLHRRRRTVDGVSIPALAAERDWPLDGPLDALFGALADPTRRAIIVDLVHHGPRSATRLADGAPLTRQAVVKHLQALESAGLVTSQRVGREVQFRATPERLAAAVGWLLDAGATWDRRIDRLRASTAPRA